MKLMINARRNGYGPDQCRRTITVGELIDELRQERGRWMVASKNEGYEFFELEVKGANK